VLKRPPTNMWRAYAVRLVLPDEACIAGGEKMEAGSLKGCFQSPKLADDKDATHSPSSLIR